MLSTTPALPPHLPGSPATDLSAVWRASELSVQCQSTLDTGYAALNRVLPGGGWPLGAMVEVLQPQAGRHEWGLLLPALAALNAPTPWAAPQAFAHPGTRQALIALTGAPYLPFGPALGACQLHMPQLLSVQTEPGNAPALLWATREALQCAEVAVVLAWLPDARSAHLRRLQIAANTHHKLLFVFRALRAQHESSPAPLRLRLACAPTSAAADADGQGANLQVHLLKRRGPPLAAPVLLDTLPARLSALLAASRERARSRSAGYACPAPAPAVPSALAASGVVSLAALSPFFSRLGALNTAGTPGDALDRTASLHH